MGEKADQTLKEFTEAWEQARKIEQEALDLVKKEGQKDYKLIEAKLREADGFIKKRDAAFKRHLSHVKRGQ